MNMNVDGKRIRSLRLERSWSQETLAEQAGVSLRTVQRMEVEGIASLHSRRAVAGALNVPVTELDAPTGGPPPAEDADTDEPRPVDLAPEARPSPPVATRTGVLAAAWILSLVAVALGTSHWTSRQRLDDPDDEPVAAAEPSVVTVGYGNIGRTVAVRGTLLPRQTVPATARASGELVEISVALGDVVEEGQRLARLDAAEQELRVRSSELNLEMMRNQLRQRELSVRMAENRFGQLAEADNPETEFALMLDEARHELLSAESDLQNLMLQIEQHETALERERIQLAYTEIKAPITGTVISIDQKTGAFIDARQGAPTMFQIADLAQLTAKVEILESDVASLSGVMEGEVTTMGRSDRRWTGQLRQINPMPSLGSVIAYLGLVDIDNADRALYPGMTVTVAFATAFAEDVLRVPVTALTFDRATGDAGSAAVEVVLPDGTTDTRDIVVGIMDGRDAEVVSGLAEGDRVIARVPDSSASAQ